MRGMGRAGVNGSHWSACAVLLLSSLALAQAPPSPADPPGMPDLSDLAFRFQNPISDVASLLVREELRFNVGPEHRVESFSHILADVPFSVRGGWNLVPKLDLPVVLVGDPVDPTVTYWGLGDTELSAVAATPRRFDSTWGLGPALLLPTASSNHLGTGKWSAGPSVAWVFQHHPWTLGTLAEQVWSFAGSDTRPGVSRLRILPVVSYDLTHAWYLTSAPEIVADWKAPSGQTWLVPIGAGIGKLYGLGPIPFDLQLEGFYDVVRPDTGPRWSVQAQIGLVESR